MKSIAKIIVYECNDILRGKWIILYALFFFLITFGLIRFEGDAARVILSLMNIVLILIPLVSGIFGTLYLYNSREFVELLLCQPINRTHLFVGLYSGVSAPLCISFVIGVGVPLFFISDAAASNTAVALLLLALGVVLTCIFTALAFFIALRSDDRARGLGAAVLIWLLLAVVYDGIVLLVTVLFQDYPLEQPLIVVSLTNPIDLARVILLLQMDVSALMGYTGAVFQEFFGQAKGITLSAGVLALWIGAPFWLGLRTFRRKDF